jgi:hypothetical protein
MVASVHFRLDDPDGLPVEAAPAVAAEPADPTGDPAQESDGAGVPTPPRLPYAPDPGTYTQMWLQASTATTAQDMKEEVETYIQVYTRDPIDYTATSNAILTSTDGLCFLTILAGNQVCVVHSLGRFNSGLGRNTPANNRVFGLLGEKVGKQLPPTVMVPSAGLVPWLTLQSHHQPTDADLAPLKGADATSRTVETPTVEGGEDEDDDDARPKVSVQNICYLPKAWAPYFLAPMAPWDALSTYKQVLATMPTNVHDSFDYLHAWLTIACTHVTKANESILKAKWQSPHVDRRMIVWMQRHTQYVNAMPMGSQATIAGATLDPQECFNKALETVAALKPTLEAKKYSTAELQRLRAACSLTVAEMATNLPEIHERLLEEGRTTRSIEAVLAHALCPTEEQDDPGLIYISPELVADVKNCKYGLGWDTSYRNCHRGISPFAVPHMSMKHQQERGHYQERLGKASATTVTDIEKGEGTPSPAPQDYHGLLQLLANYQRLLVVLVGSKSAHTREVTAMRRKLRAKIDLYAGIGPREILYLLWAIFLDAREFFSQQIAANEPCPESQLRYTTSFLGIGRIPIDIMGVPLSQFGVGPRSTNTTVGSSRSGNEEPDMFRPAD